MHRAIVMVFLLIWSASPSIGLAQSPVPSPTPFPFVAHPVSLPLAARTAGGWRTGVGAWGEEFAKHRLRNQGYNDIRSIKFGGNQGVDVFAIRRDRLGNIVDARHIEVKTDGKTKPSLRRNRDGSLQMSRKDQARQYRRLLRSPNPENRHLARELSRFYKSQGRSSVAFSEIHHINPYENRYAIYTPDGKTIKEVKELDRILRKLRWSFDKHTRSYAASARREWSHIGTTRMAPWLDGLEDVTRVATRPRPGRAAVTFAARFASGRVIGKIFVRAAGPIALLVSSAGDATEFYSAIADYNLGRITYRERNRRLGSIVGGGLGATGGALAGAAAGAWVGAFGGPFAWITVPTGALAGGVIGAAGGYVGGEAVALKGVDAWYDSVDASLRAKLEQQMIGKGWLSALE